MAKNKTAKAEPANEAAVKRLKEVFDTIFDEAEFYMKDFDRDMIISDISDEWIQKFPEMKSILRKDVFGYHHLCPASMMSLISIILCGKSIIFNTDKSNENTVITGIILS